MNKLCIKCNKEQIVENFYKKPSGQLIACCKKCYRERANRWYSKNKEAVLIHKKYYFQTNKNKITKRMGQYKTKRIKNDLNFKIANNLRSRLYHALNKNYKSGSAVRDLGCSIDELKTYLESKFLPGMSWETYGKEWEIDHLWPLSKFDLTDRKQFLEACHYTNLQPLWWQDNVRKGNNF